MGAADPVVQGHGGQVGEGSDLVHHEAQAGGLRARPVAEVVPVGGEGGREEAAVGVHQRPHQDREHLLLVVVDRLGVAHRDDVGRGDALEHADLLRGPLRHHELGVVAGQRVLAVDVPGGADRGHREAADELARHVLQPGEVLAGPVHLPDPQGRVLEAGQGGVEGLGRGLRQVPAPGELEHPVPLGGVGEPAQLHEPGGDRVLDVVHGVGDVVREIHDLGLEALGARRGAVAQPREHRQVVRVDPELRGPGPVRAQRRLVGLPGVLAHGVQHGAGEVQAGGPPVVVEHLGLEPGQQAQGLRVALEAADVLGQPVQGRLPVVPERRVPEVVGEAGGVDDVGVAAEHPAQLPADLGDLEGVGQAVAHEVVGVRGDDLGLGRQPPQPRGVKSQLKMVNL